MHVITRKRLNAFAERHPDAKSSLARWYAIMRRSRFLNFAQLRTTFPHADQVGKFTVSNIGGNRVRLIAAVHIIEQDLHPPCVDSPGVRRRQMERVICRSPNSKKSQKPGQQYHVQSGCRTRTLIIGNLWNYSTASRDDVGEDENHPLASLMDVLGVLIEKYEDEHVPELTE
jgi:mRNA interferase HigB